MNPFDRFRHKLTMPDKRGALPGRDEPIRPPQTHYVLGTRLAPEFPSGTQRALFGMGCFWGAERLFWQQPGVYTTAVGYSAGYTPNPTYEEVCSGQTGHNEVVLVVYYPEQIAYKQLLKCFWENHNPCQGMRQANDIGTQYRSGIYWFNEQQKGDAEESLRAYQALLTAEDQGRVTTEVEPATSFYYAEDYHQQYLAKNPQGYCNLQTVDKTGLPHLDGHL